jgi:hypothetical protein
LLDSKAALNSGCRHLALWLKDVEDKWEAHSNKDLSGKPRATLSKQLDHMGKLSVQAGSGTLKLAYTKAGIRLSAALIDDSRVIIDHKAYWITPRGIDEGRYLEAVINSEVVLKKVVPSQSHGQQDPRDFDKLVWTLPIPEFDPVIDLHNDITAAAARAEKAAATVEFPEHAHFTTKRRAIRDALAADGVAKEIDTLVAALLDA